jgi:transcriptional regulator with GAF, ATPase, and Fis domain
MPENLLESELFGYVKGAFTGADRDHKGLFAAAESGTIHLDEIGDISPAIQTKLLRCLQDGEIRPVGANQSRLVDVRVVASTNKDIEACLHNRSFREDLYYRLNVLSIVLPPLRERSEDIPLLAQCFLRDACREMGLADREIEAEALQWMVAQSWPGNVRELQNFVRRLTVFSTGERVDMGVVAMVQGGEPVSLPGIVSTGGANPRPAVYKEAKSMVVNAFTHEYVRAILTLTKGNISQAAKISGLSRVALQKILTRTGEKANRFR